MLANFFCDQVNELSQKPKGVRFGEASFPFKKRKYYCSFSSLVSCCFASLVRISKKSRERKLGLGEGSVEIGISEGTGFGGNGSVTNPISAPIPMIP